MTRKSKRQPELSQDAADYLESLALNIPIDTVVAKRPDRVRPTRLFNVILAAAIVAALGAMMWLFVPPSQPPGAADVPHTGGRSDCHVSGKNLVISVPCTELNRWLEGEGP